MDLDLLFVLGICLAVLMVPAVVSAILDGRAPRTPAFLVVVSAVLIGYPIVQKPGSYSFQNIPDIFAKVIGQYVG